MSSAMIDGPVTVPFGRAHAEVDEFLAAVLSRLDSAELLESWRELERLRNRLAAVEHGLIGEAERRGLPFDYAARDVAALIRGLLRVDPREAKGRVFAADAAVGRTTLTGDPTPAPFPTVAAAQQSGVISPRHARVIVTAVEGLPDALQAEHGVQVEAELVEHARTFDPGELGKIALRMTLLLNQDGTEPDEQERRRRRCLTIRQRPDGSASISGEATVELAERLLAVLDATAAPKPDGDGNGDGVPDRRNAGQRNHDGLLDALNLLQRADVLPECNGISTTVLLTMTQEAWDTGRGVATTGHGAVITAREAIRIAGGDARATTITLNQYGGIENWTDSRRLFTENQRLAMIARDGGCSFPGCDVPPAWCQAHHVVPHVRGGPTIVDNGALVCGFHHREHEEQGWRSIMINSRPAWIPPPWTDPEQKPRQNALHRS